MSYFLLLVLLGGTPLPAKAAAATCPSGAALERVWQTSYSRAGRSASALSAGLEVDLSQLQEDLAVLRVVSGIEEGSGDYSPVDQQDLTEQLSRFTRWFESSRSELCATPSRGGGEQSARGCPGQRRLALLWLQMTERLGVLLTDPMRETTPNDLEREQLIEFFSSVSEIPAEVDRERLLGEKGWLELGATAAEWQEWFADHVGAFCSATRQSSEPSSPDNQPHM